MIMRAPILSLLLVPSLLTAQWVDISTGMADELEAIVVLDAQTYLASGDAGAYRTTDGGATWALVPGLWEDGVRDFLRLDAQTLLGAGDGFVLRSTNNGTSWTSVPAPAPDDLHALARSGSTVVGVGRDGGIVRSNDLGLTWALQPSGTTERLFCAWAFSPTEMLAAGEGGIALRTTNGSTWTPITLPVTDEWLGLQFFPSAPEIGLFVGEEGTVLRSTDGGDTWAPVSTGSTMGLTALVITASGEAIATGLTGAAIRSLDQGQTWTVMSSPVTTELGGIDAMAGTVVACGMGGTVLKLDPEVGIAAQDDPLPFELWPVPANDAVNLAGRAFHGLTTARIHAMDGRVVAQRTWSGDRTAIDVGMIPAGAYSVVVTDAQGRRTARPLLVLH